MKLQLITKRRVQYIYIYIYIYIELEASRENFVLVGAGASFICIGTTSVSGACMPCEADVLSL